MFFFHDMFGFTFAMQIYVQNKILCKKYDLTQKVQLQKKIL